MGKAVNESQSPDTLPPTYEDAIGASEENSRNDVDIMLYPGVDICMSDPYDGKQSWENSLTSQPTGMVTSIDTLLIPQDTFRIEDGVHTDQFSMDGMLLKPWNTDLGGVNN
jgi:hypothetical protein